MRLSPIVSCGLEVPLAAPSVSKPDMALFVEEEELGRRKRETNEAATPGLLELDVVLLTLTLR